MFLIVEVCVLPIAMLIALCRTVNIAALFPLKLVCVVFVDVMRGIPTILLVFLIGFGVPALNLSGVPSSAIVLGCIALAMCYSAYVSEVFRAGIQSIHPSQGGAALALGLTRAQALRYVILPQAVRRVIPPLLNDFISLQKDVRWSRSWAWWRRSKSHRSTRTSTSTSRRWSPPRCSTCA